MSAFAVEYEGAPGNNPLDDQEERSDWTDRCSLAR